jgi:hypothetical protein
MASRDDRAYRGVAGQVVLGRLRQLLGRWGQSVGDPCFALLEDWA